MKLIKHQLNLLLLVALIIIQSCITNKNPQLSDKQNLPSSYNSNVGSSKDSLKSTKDFFKDKILIGLIDSALNNNFDLLRAIQRIEFAKANYLNSKGVFLPSLNIAANSGVDKFSKNTMNGLGNFDTNLSPNLPSNTRIPDPTPDYFLGLRSSWEVGIWGKYKNLKKSAFQRLVATENGKRLIQTSLVAQVASLYFQLLALDSELEIINRNLILQQAALDNIEILKQGARANELAVQQFNAQVLDTKSLQARKEQDIVYMENALNTILGRYPQTIERGTKIIEQTIPQEMSTGIPTNLLFKRPDIMQAENLLSASSADLAVARAAFFPSLTINSYAGYNSFKSSLLFEPSSVAYGVIAGLMGPVFNRFEIKANYKRAKAMQMDAFYNYQFTLVNGYQEVLTNLKGIENYQKVYNLKAEEVIALNKAVSASNDLFFAGAATYLDVITARRFALDSELQQTNSKRDQLLYMVELYRALGGGWN
ncbi:MAG: TolC family protein [Cytophagales bacterium]|nr:MAG: TolC family protein [Cytophagales bacterium]